MKTAHRGTSLGSIALFVCAAATAWGVENTKPPRRARPTAWPPEVTDVFFKDAREHLVGVRPEASPSPKTGEAASKGTAATESDETRTFAWSRLVDGETLATEVKRVAARLHEPLANTTRFKADGHKQCRADFGELAVLFGVIAEYDGDVRWRDDAPALRDALARASRNCKTATDQSFAEATQRLVDLDEIVRGGRLAHSAAAPLDQWSSLANRSVLMLRMQTAWRDNISPQLSDARQFGKSAVEVHHEAQLLAMLSEVIHRKRYENWDDDTFAEYSRELQDAATALSRAATDGNYEAARKASGRAGQACATCHDDYRG